MKVHQSQVFEAIFSIKTIKNFPTGVFSAFFRENQAVLNVLA
jgi:hypothetical protein